MVVTDGDTVGEPVKLPGCQVYDVPPVALNCTNAPAQTVEGFAVVETTGSAFTRTVLVAVLLHPFAFVPVTVYVVVTTGNTVGEPVKLPGCHV